MADINLKAGNNIELRQDNDDLYIDGADQTPMNVELIALSDTAPTECVENDKYYNTEDNLVYTATDTDTWSEDGEEPIKDIFYILISNLKLYIYDSETLVEVSGSEPVPSNVELIAVTETAPSECNEGDKYFNTTTKKIYTATSENTWGSEGVDPILDIFYIVLSEQKIYTYDGDTLISVGGGSGGITVHDSYSTSIIEPYSANYVNGIADAIPTISNTYGTSQTDGYTQEYINNKINEITAKSYKFTEMYKNSTVSVVAGETKSIGTLVMETHGKPLMVFASVNSRTANNNGGCSFYVDGVSNRSMITIGPSQHEYNDMAIVTNVEAGTHTFELKVKADSNSGTITVYPYYINSFTIFEL